MGEGRSGASLAHNSAVARSLLWYSRKPWDPERKGVAFDAIRHILEFVDTEKKQPPRLNSPRWDRETLPQYRRFVTRFVEFTGSTLVTGVFVATFTALLKLWSE